MTENNFTYIKKIICCPYCHGDLEWKKKFARCIKCLDKYPIQENSIQIDLRLKRPKKITTTQIIDVNVNSFNNNGSGGVHSFEFGYEKNENGRKFNYIPINYKKPVEKLYSWLPEKEGFALDIGSAKDKKNRHYLESAGFTYISADYDSPEAKILLDAHSLPFKDKSIKCITNLAVMEHIEHPHIAGREFHRVLERDGRMLGVVAFLQQQHMSSWYHFTHFGVYSWLCNSGFKPHKIKIDAADKRYHGIYNTASLIGLPKWIKKTLLDPIYIFHRLLWWIYQKKSKQDLEKKRHLQTTGALHFIATK